MKLTSRQIEVAVYVVGVAVLGFVQGTVRSHLGDAWAFAAVIVYLFALRGVGLALARSLGHTGASK